MSKKNETELNSLRITMKPETNRYNGRNGRNGRNGAKRAKRAKRAGGGSGAVSPYPTHFPTTGRNG